jgi:hypothetical protein
MIVEKDTTLGGRVIGYQVDRLTGLVNVWVSNGDLKKRKVDAFSRPYGFESPDLTSRLGHDVFFKQRSCYVRPSGYGRSRR